MGLSVLADMKNIILFAHWFGEHVHVGIFFIRSDYTICYEVICQFVDIFMWWVFGQLLLFEKFANFQDVKSIIFEEIISFILHKKGFNHNSYWKCWKKFSLCRCFANGLRRNLHDFEIYKYSSTRYIHVFISYTK